jgi:hypothetical protein
MGFLLENKKFSVIHVLRKIHAHRPFQQRKGHNQAATAKQQDKQDDANNDKRFVLG